eukprot:474859-Amphidinium_carterae.1
MSYPQLRFGQDLIVIEKHKQCETLCGGTGGGSEGIFEQNSIIGYRCQTRHRFFGGGKLSFATVTNRCCNLALHVVWGS